jgi:hypothetical protein
VEYARTEKLFKIVLSACIVITLIAACYLLVKAQRLSSNMLP